MGFSRISGRARPPFSGFSYNDGNERDRCHPGRRPGGRGPRFERNRRYRNPRRSGRWRRRAALDGAVKRRVQGGQSRRPDGRVVDAPVASARRPFRRLRARAGEPHVHHAGPRRLLAVRLRYPQRFGRRTHENRHRRVPRRNSGNVAVAGGARERAESLERRQAAHGGGGPAAALASAGPALHRRRRPRHVADRRSGH